MPILSVKKVAFSSAEFDRNTPFALSVEFSVDVDIVFDAAVAIDIVNKDDGAVISRNYSNAGGLDISWLPRGAYRIYALAPSAALPPGCYDAHIAVLHADGGTLVKVGEGVAPFKVNGNALSGDASHFSWQIQSLPGTFPIEMLPWKQGAGDWFSKHFDHEVRTTISYLLGDSPLLKGKVLNVGCGDGIADLGIALRMKSQEVIGIDPFRDYERLPEILKQAKFPIGKLPANLSFLPASANEIPFPEDYFDVVISWGSLEHIVGGYLQALNEIRRVLKPGGLLMAHPGLFYSDIGNHLGEFPFAREEPYVHLKHSRDWLREKVLSSEPDRMDRCGGDATPAQYWQCFIELNPITVSEFEEQLRIHDFEPWRVALRTHDRVDYTPELQKYSFIDLAVGELYVSAYNRKKVGEKE